MNFQERYNNIKRVILELKTGHDVRSNMRTFYIEQEVQEIESYTPTTFRLTYAEGTQPIMTAAISEPSLIPLKPSGNTQDFYLAILDGNLVLATKISFLSTRKIESIEVIQ